MRWCGLRDVGGIVVGIRRALDTKRRKFVRDSRYDVGIAFVQACCCFQLLRSHLEKGSHLRHIGSALRATARHLEVDGYAVQCVTNIVGQLLEYGRLVEIIH